MIHKYVRVAGHFDLWGVEAAGSVIAKKALSENPRGEFQ